MKYIAWLIRSVSFSCGYCASLPDVCFRDGLWTAGLQRVCRSMSSTCGNPRSVLFGVWIHDFASLKRRCIHIDIGAQREDLEPDRSWIKPVDRSVCTLWRSVTGCDGRRVYLSQEYTLVISGIETFQAECKQSSNTQPNASTTWWDLVGVFPWSSKGREFYKEFCDSFLTGDSERVREVIPSSIDNPCKCQSTNMRSGKQLLGRIQFTGVYRLVDNSCQSHHSSALLLFNKRLSH